ncbi:MAG: Glu/Leu/Phe/Val dehydrogenase dimerization domain-containing protein [Chloroflexota bacterium]
MSTSEAVQPQMRVIAHNETWGDIGYLIIDSVLSDAAIGGIRYAPGISQDEVAGLAQAMTYKCGFFNIPMGGAKAGIPARAELSSKERSDMLQAFGRSIGPIIRSGLYVPGQDIGFSVADLNDVRLGAGLPPVKTVYNGGLYTAMTVVETAAAVLKSQGRPFEGTRFAIEGLGNVGIHVASLVTQRGGVLMAVSTVNGAIYQANGLDTSRLSKLRARYSDDLISHYYDADSISLEDLLLLDVDVLVPCARSHAIHGGNAGSLRAPIIVPASNNPVAPGAADVIHDSSIVLFPDFVANGGSVLAGMLITQGFDDAEICDMIRKEFAQRVHSLIRQAGHDTDQLRQTAETIAKRNIERMQRESLAGSSRLIRVIMKLREKGPIGLLERGANLLYQHGWNRSRRVRTLARRRMRNVLLAEG